MSEPKLTKTAVETLYRELEQLESYVDPKPDPDRWPPVGWEEHPQRPGYFFRVMSEADLREEIFGSEEKTEWLKRATARIQEIRNALISYFFPNAKDEGTQRATRAGFVVMLKTGLMRKFDTSALPSVVAECQAIANRKNLEIDVESTAVAWEPKLRLKEYRELPNEIRKQFDAALVITPMKSVFEIVRVED